MEYLKVVIGGAEMYIPVNDKLCNLILLTHKRLNFQKRIAKMRKVNLGKIEHDIVMDSEFFYLLEEVFEESGYLNEIHFLIQNNKEYGKILYALLREDETLSSLIGVSRYDQDELQKVIRRFFEALKKNIF